MQVARNSIFYVRYYMTERMFQVVCFLWGGSAKKEDGAVERLEIRKEPHPCPVEAGEGGLMLRSLS